MAKKNTKKTNNLATRIDRKRELQERLEDLGYEASDISIKTSSARTSQSNARNLLLSLRSTVERERDNSNPSNKNALRNQEVEFRELGEHCKALENRMLEIDEERDSIHKAIHECDAGAQLDEVLSHIEEVSKAKAEVDNLTTLIQEKESGVTGTVDDQDSQLEELQSIRADLLASIALGEDKQGDLDNLDQQIEKLLRDSDATHSVAVEEHRHTKQTITGLDRLLQKAYEKLQQLREHTPEVVRQFLISQAEQAGKSYLKHAEHMIEDYKCIKALEDIARQSVGEDAPVFLATAFSKKIMIPAINLRCFENVDLHEDSNRILFSSENVSPNLFEEYKNKKDDELQRFKEMGIEGFF